MLAIIPPAFTAPVLPGSAPSPARGSAAPAEHSFSRQLEQLRDARAPQPTRPSAAPKPPAAPNPPAQATGQQAPKPVAAKAMAGPAQGAASPQAKAQARAEAAAADAADAADAKAMRKTQAEGGAREPADATAGTDSADSADPSDTSNTTDTTISELLARLNLAPEANMPPLASSPTPMPVADPAALPLATTVPLADPATAATAIDAAATSSPTSAIVPAGAVAGAAATAGPATTAAAAAALTGTVAGRPASGDAMALAPIDPNAMATATPPASLSLAPQHTSSRDAPDIKHTNTSPDLGQQAQAAALLAQAATSALDSRATDPRFADGRAVEATGALDTAALAGGLTGPGNPLAHTAKAADVVTASLATPATSAEFRAALGMQVSVLARGGVQQAELHLNPAEMGPVSIQIVLDGQEAQVNFGADSAHTRQIIEAGMPELASALREAGLTLTGGGVSQHAGGQRHDPGSNETSRGRTAGANSDTTHEQAADPRTEQTRRSSVRSALGGVDLYA